MVCEKGVDEGTHHIEKKREENLLWAKSEFCGKKKCIIVFSFLDRLEPLGRF